LASDSHVSSIHYLETPLVRPDSPHIDVVVGIIRDDDGRVLINQRRSETHLAGLWEFPGGKREAGESWQSALLRELDEELGIAVLRAEPLLTVSHDYPDRQVRLNVWTVLSFTGKPYPREQQPIVWVRPQEMAGIEFLPADLTIIAELQKVAGATQEAAQGASQGLPEV
jgi:8-oxo-dGTP diphosphatase